MALSLRDDVYFCIANDQVVFLNLRADRYYGLPPAMDAAFKRLLSYSASETDRNTLAPLMQRGVLVEVPQAKDLAPIEFIPPTRSLLDTLQPQSNIVPSRKAVRDYLWTMGDLQFQRLQQILTRIGRRKQRALAWGDFKPIDILDEYIEAFLSIRAVMPTQEQCLKSSLALIRYMARDYRYPDLVIGVKMQPFAAHAWVQHGDLVLNDTLDNVLAYTPILVV